MKTGKELRDWLNTLPDNLLELDVLVGPEMQIWHPTVSAASMGSYNSTHAPDDYCDECPEDLDFENCPHTRRVLWLEVEWYD